MKQSFIEQLSRAASGWVLLSALCLLMASETWAQQRAVTGVVRDANNEVLPSVSVTVKGTTRGTVVDVNGRYKIDATANETLVFSSIGFVKQEVVVGNRSTIDVAMKEDVAALNEVVVVGYGTQKRSDLTGAVVSLGAKQIREVPGVNILQSLAGRAAGVDIQRNGTRPGAGAQLRIRGNRSLSGSNDALIVVDNVPYGGSLNDLNPEDIASIDILKDASATAIFGSRGSNGVVMITTKKGKTGKPQLAYSASYGSNNIINQYPMLSGAEFKEMRDLSRYSAGNSPDETAGIQNGTSTNWQDYFYRNGSIMKHDLTLTGGGDNFKYGIGAGYEKETGVVPGQDFSRFSMRTSLETNINKRIKVGLTNLSNLNYTNGESNAPIYNVLRLSPLTSPTLPDGSINLRPLFGTVDELASMHPATLNNKEAIVETRRRLTTFNSLYGELNILDGLTYKINVGLDFRQENYGRYLGPNTILNPGSILPNQNSAVVQNGESWRYAIDNILTYDKTFGEKHHVTFTGLYGVQQDRGFNSRVEGSGLPADAIQFYNLNLAASTSVPGNNNFFSRNGLIGMMARVNYVFADRYLLTATFRRDGSSVFPGGTWLNYPAFALGWNLTNESFMSNISFVNNLKLRAGWGMSGNQGIPAGATRGSLSTNRYNFGATNSLGYFVSGLGNRDLRWETTQSTNVGLDFGFLGNRITGSFEWYQQVTDGLLVQKNLPLSNGANSYWTNAAKTQSRGIELTVSTVNVDTRSGIKWTTDFNVFLNREKIVELEDPAKVQDIGNGWFVGQPINVIYDFTKAGIWQTSEAEEARKYNRVPGQIKIADLNNDGAINDRDRSVIGTFQPDWIGGMTNTVSYKNFDLSFSLYARMGGKLVATYFQNDGTGTGYAFLNSGRVNQIKMNYWTPTNPTNAFPMPAPNDRIDFSSTLGYYDAPFVRVQSINLGYNVPTKWISKLALGSARLFFTSRNPFILYSPFVSQGLGIDPEGTGTGGAVPTQGAGAGNGVTGRAITIGLAPPPTRQFTLGLNVKF